MGAGMKGQISGKAGAGADGKIGAGADGRPGGSANAGSSARIQFALTFAALFAVEAFIALRVHDRFVRPSGQNVLGCKEYIRAPGAQAGNRRRQECFRQEQPEGTCQEYPQWPVPPGRTQEEAQTGITGSIHTETADSGAAGYTSDCGYPCFHVG